MATQIRFRDSIGLLLRSAYLSMHRYHARLFSAEGITADQWVLLKLLSEEDGVTQKALGDRAYADANSTTYMLRLLEKRKFVKRRADPRDGRAILVYVTPKARQVLARFEASYEPAPSVVRLFVPGPPPAVASWLRKTADAFANNTGQKETKSKRRRS